MKTPAMEAALESIAQVSFGRSRSTCASNKLCVSCGNAADKFRDALSEKEYGISRLCQKCQDSVFGA